MSENNPHTIGTAPSSPRYSGYTMGPNWIYDALLLKESYSVAKVVMFVNRNTTGRTGPGGHRIEVVQASYGHIAREMEMSLRAVGEGVRVALARGYLIQVKAGRAATENKPGEGGWYALNWNWPSLPDLNSIKLEEPLLAQTLPISTQVLATPSEEAVQILPVATKVQTLPEPAVQTLPAKPAQLGQILPEPAVQTLPPCINKPDSNSNKLVEIKTPRIISTSPAKAEKVETEPKDQPSSFVIAHLISDLTREFGDNLALIRPNTSRTLNLWHKSNLPEPEFLGLIYQARQKTLSGGLIQHRRMDANGNTSDLPNRMPYFFAVLSDLIANPQQSTHPEAQLTPSLPNNLSRRAKPIPARQPLASQSEVVSYPTASPTQPQSVAEAVWTEPDQLKAAPTSKVGSGLWEEVLPQLTWLPQTKREALAQAELVPITNPRTPARFELKFARNWQKSIFTGWELDQIALVLGPALGQQLYPGAIML